MKNHLKSLRNNNNISQDELASILKVSRQTINSIEIMKKNLRYMKKKNEAIQIKMN